MSSFVFGQEITENFYPFKDANGWGVKKADGTALFSERYDSVLVKNYFPFKNRIRVSKNEKWGVVDSFGAELIPISYPFLDLDQFGYRICEESGWSSDLYGFLNFQGDTIVPYAQSFLTSEPIGDGSDFMVHALKETLDDKYAIFSSDGVQRSDYEFDEIIGIDSSKLKLTLFSNDAYNYFGIHSVKTNKCGIYNALEKRIVIPPIYESFFIAWWNLPTNPHFLEGPIVYTGSTPTFQMSLNGVFRLMNVSGDIVFSSDEYEGWDENKKYYVNEAGEAHLITGKCVDPQFMMSAPYVMKDEKGVFLVDDEGEPIYGEKRFYSIEKLNYSSIKDPKMNAFVIQNKKDEAKSLFDAKLIERTPKEYQSIKFDVEHKSFLAKRENSTVDFYDTLFTQLDYDPTKYFQNRAYSFYEDGKYGIKSKDGDVVLPAVHSMIESHPNYGISNDTTFFIVSDCSGSVDVYNAEVEKILHFEGDYFKFMNHYDGWKKTYLQLFNKSKLSIYCFTTKSWVFKDQQCIPMDCTYGHLESPRKYNLEPRIEFHDKKRFFWVYNYESGWSLFNDEGDKFLNWNRAKAIPRISSISGNHVLAIQEVETDGNTQLFFSNATSDELVLDGRLRDYQYIPELDRFYISYGENSIKNTYDNHFNLIEKDRVEGLIRYRQGESFFLQVDRDKKICTVINRNGKTVIPGSSYVKNDPDITGMYKVYSDSGSYIVTEDAIRKYESRIYDVSKKVIAGVIWGEDAVNGKFDFYSTSGKLLFPGYQFVRNHHQNSKDGYFIIKNDEEELWVRNDGVVFHRNALK